MSQQLTIDVYFDFICPWCLIGKRHIDAALAQWQNENPKLIAEINWHGVQLLPELPTAGVPFDEFYLRRLGSALAVQKRQQQVQQAAASTGITIDFSMIKTMPNTAAAHRLFSQAAALGGTSRRDTLLKQLFTAYFHRGENLGSPEVLLAIAEECGYNLSEFPCDLLRDASSFSPTSTQHVPNSVPYFEINNQLGLSGAQPGSVLLDAFRRVQPPIIAETSFHE